MDLTLLDRVAVATLGIPIASRTLKAANEVNQNSLVRKFVRETSRKDRRDFANQLHQAHDPYASLVPRVKTAEIGRTLKPGEPLTEADIVLMVKSFLLALRKHAYVVTVVKRLLLHDLTTKLEAVHPGESRRNGSRCILTNLVGGVQRLAQETFVLR